MQQIGDSDMLSFMLAIQIMKSKALSVLEINDEEHCNRSGSAMHRTTVEIKYCMNQESCKRLLSLSYLLYNLWTTNGQPVLEKFVT